MAAKQHGARFIKLVDEVRPHIKECTVNDVKARLDRGEQLLLVDVREESEFAADHIPNALHVGKGVLERDIEAKVPDPAKEIILYCGGGYRSAIAAFNLQKMGYTNVISMDGGIRGWKDAGFPVVK